MAETNPYETMDPVAKTAEANPYDQLDPKSAVTENPYDQLDPHPTTMDTGDMAAARQWAKDNPNAGAIAGVLHALGVYGDKYSEGSAALKGIQGAFETPDFVKQLHVPQIDDATLKTLGATSDTGKAVAKGIAGGASAALEFGKSMTAPANVMLVGGMSGLSQLAKIYPWAQKAYTAAKVTFATQMAGQTVEGGMNEIDATQADTAAKAAIAQRYGLKNVSQGLYDGTLGDPGAAGGPQLPNAPRSTQQVAASRAGVGLTAVAGGIAGLDAVHDLVNPEPPSMANQAAQAASSVKKGQQNVQNVINSFRADQAKPVQPINPNPLGAPEAQPQLAAPEAQPGLPAPAQPILLDNGPLTNAQPKDYSALDQWLSRDEGKAAIDSIPETFTEAKSKDQQIKEAVNTKGIDIQYSVFRPGEGIPNAVQVDVISPDKKESLTSANPESIRKAGVDIPDVPDYVPQGRYTLAELNQLIAAHDQQPNSPVTINSADQPAANISQPGQAPDVLSQVPQPEGGQLANPVGQGGQQLGEPTVQGGSQETVSPTKLPVAREAPIPDALKEPPPLLTYTAPTQLRKFADGKFNTGYTMSAAGTVPTKSINNLLAKLGVSQDELALYKAAGIDSQLKYANTNLKDLAKWMDANAPQVETKKLDVKPSGSGGGEAQHYLETQGFRVEGNQVFEPQAYGGRAITDVGDPAIQDYGNRTLTAVDRIIRSADLAKSDAATGRFGVEPKRIESMPGAVDILARIPAKTPAAKNWREIQNPNPGSGVQFRGPHFGSSDVNVLGSVRGYIETLPSGEKVFHVFEVQSDWGQDVAKFRDMFKKYQSQHPGATWEDYSKGVKKYNQPLVDQYEQIALKAAIDHARSLGINKLAISDADTAMMTEMHDTNAALRTTRENEQPVISQEPGMRAAYDERLPAIMQKITGDKGVPVDFGLHKAADESATPSYIERHPDSRPLGSPVFKDAQGQPKKNVTAKMYDIGGAPGQFKAFGYGEGGFITPQIAAHLAGAAGGALIGYSQGDTPEERLRYAIAGGLTGFFLVKGAGALIRARGKLVQMWNSQPVKEAMVVGRDAADNASGVFARQQANTLRNAIKRVFPKDQELAQKALGIIVEARGDELGVQAHGLTQIISNMGNKVATSTDATPKWKKEYLKAATFAIQNQTDLGPIADDYTKITDTQHNLENGLGVESPYRKGYVFHAQDINSNDPLSAILSGGGGQDSASFKKMREFNTHADSIAAGTDPKSINAVDLLEARLRIGGKMVNDKQWLVDLHTMTDPTTGDAVVKPAERVDRPDGTFYYNAPDGYSMQTYRGQPLAISKNYADTFKALTEPGISPGGLGNLVQQANQTGKSLKLAVDTYHLGRISFNESAAKAAGVPFLGTGKLPVPSFIGKGLAYGGKMRGITLLDHTVPEIQLMAQRGEIPPEWTNQLVQNKQNINLLIKNGMNIGGIADNMHQDFIHSIPGLHQFNHWLFDQYQRSAMTEVGLLEFERQTAMYPEKTPDQVARQVAEDINTKFGNLGRQGWFTSKRSQDVLRMLFLAPQWNEGLIRSQMAGIGELPKVVKDVATGKGLRSGLLPRALATTLIGYFLMNQLINYYTRGKPTWDNPEEGFAAKISAWVPDKIGSSSGFFMNPMGLGAETFHVIGHRLEQGEHWWDAGMDFLQSRSSVLASPFWAVARHKEAGGIPIGPTGKDMAGAVGRAIQPLPIPAGSLWQGITQAVTGNPAEDFPGQFQRQMISSTGLRPDLAPSALARIYKLAADYNEKHNIPQHSEAGKSPWSDLNRTLQVGNMASADKELAKVLVDHDPQQVFDYYNKRVNAPFTGKMEREVAFIETLNPEQKQAYIKAYEMRDAQMKASVKMLYNAYNNGTLAKAYIDRMDTMSDADANAFLQKQIQDGLLDEHVQQQIMQIRQSSKK